MLVRYSAKHILRSQSALPQQKMQQGVYREKSNLGRNTGDHFDFEIEPGQPVDTNRRPVRIGRLIKDGAFHVHDCFELMFWICMERCDVNDVIDGAVCGFEHGLEIVKCKGDLLAEIGFGRTVFAAANLARNEEQVTGLYGR